MKYSEFKKFIEDEGFYIEENTEYNNPAVWKKIKVECEEQ